MEQESGLPEIGGSGQHVSGEWSGRKAARRSAALTSIRSSRLVVLHPNWTNGTSVCCVGQRQLRPDCTSRLTESFSGGCDRYGIYVEEEAPVCFITPSDFFYTYSFQNDPRYTARFLNQFSEMIERDRNHPCVVLWSLANESAWGSNFALEYAHVKAVDPDRPVIFSYGPGLPRNVEAFDIFSFHYPKYDDDLGSVNYPRLYDEWEPPPCLIGETLKNDPNVRNFWGESLKRTWENCFLARGCLGGAIWNFADDVFMLPEGEVGNCEWGIVDGWRRPKPEYWLTKKAYSPIRIEEGLLTNPGASRPMQILVKNWFAHTDLSEITTQWSVGSEGGAITGFRLAPHCKGVLTIPPRDWKDGDVLNLKFYRAGDLLVDEYNFPVGRALKVFPEVQGPAPQIAEGPQAITVTGQNFSLVFSKATGLISRGSFQGKTILEGGPYLNLGFEKYPDLPYGWTLAALSYSLSGAEAVIKLSGFYHILLFRGDQKPAVGVDFEIRVDGNGLITTTYKLTRSSINEYVKRVGELGELGVTYLLSSQVDRLEWERQGLWSAYPPDHIGRPVGTAFKTGRGEGAQYRVEPRWPWSEDIKSFFYYGPQGGPSLGTQDFKSLKEHIWFASCLLGKSDVRARAESDGTAAVRAGVRPDGKVFMNIDNLWNYPELGWGHYMTPFSVSVGYTNTVKVRLTDNNAYQVAY